MSLFAFKQKAAERKAALAERARRMNANELKGEMVVRCCKFKGFLEQVLKLNFLL